MKKMINKEVISGYVYDHKLEIKQVKNAESANFGKNFISGSLDVQTDEAGVNVVTVHYTYVQEGTTTYTGLQSIINGNATVLNVGKENATKVKCTPSLDLNDFYTERNGQEELVSAKRNEGGFVNIVNNLDSDEAKRNTFECDIVITGTKTVDADEDAGIPEDYLIVKGAVFTFRGELLPVELICRNSGGIRYFENLDASTSNPVFTKVYGRIQSQTTVTKKEEESAFGEAIIKEYTKTVKEWVIVNAIKDPYEFDDESTITAAELKSAIAARESKLATEKQRRADYLAKKNAQSMAIPTSNAGGFSF